MIVDYVILGLSGLSFVSNLFLLIIYLLHQKLFKYPSSCLFILSLLLIFYDIHWVSAFPPLHKLIITTSNTCYAFGLLNTTIYFLVWNYTSVISLVVIGKSASCSDIYCSSRKIYYHISCILISASESLAVFLLGSFGNSRFNTCFIESNSPGEAIYLIPILLNFPVSVLAAMMMIKEKNRRDSIKPLVLSLIAIVVTWGLPTSYNLIGYFSNGFLPEIKNIMICLGASSGFWFTLMRLSNTYTIQKIRRNTKETAFYFQHISTMLVNKSMSYSMGDDTMGLTDIDMLGNFLEDSNKMVKFI